MAIIFGTYTPTPRAETEAEIAQSPVRVYIYNITTDCFVPLGIKNPQKKNIGAAGYFKIRYEIRGRKASSIRFVAYNEAEEMVGFIAFSELGAVEVEGTGPGQPRKKPVQIIYLDKYEAFEDEHLEVGFHTICWDGFNDEGVLDTAKLLGKLRFEIWVDNGNNEWIKSTQEIKTKHYSDDGRWVDARIVHDPDDATKNKIDITLRVDFRDGGTKGLDPGKSNQVLSTYGINQYEPADWDRVPDKYIQPGKPALRARNKTHEELVALALAGVAKYWSRVESNKEGKNIKVQDIPFQVATKAVDSKENCTDHLNLVFLTNFDADSNFNRSSNPGTARGLDVISWGSNVFPQRVFFQAGYFSLEMKDGSIKWYYMSENSAIEEFKIITAHELGHEILSAYGGGEYSVTHKGTSTLLQTPKKESTVPTSGEKDLMKYYDGDKYIFDRTVVAEEDILGLLSLTTLKIR